MISGRDDHQLYRGHFRRDFFGFPAHRPHRRLLRCGRHGRAAEVFVRRHLQHRHHRHLRPVQHLHHHVRLALPLRQAGRRNF